MRNMRSIGIDLARWVKEGLLTIRAVRPTLYGLESHLATMIKMANELKPKAIVVDPVTNFVGAGTGLEVRSMLVRLIDLFKTHEITTVFTSLTLGGENEAKSDAAISSLIVGARSPAQMEQNVRWFEAPVPPEFWNALKHEKLIRQDAPVP